MADTKVKPQTWEAANDPANKPKVDPVRSCIEALVLDLTRLNHPLPLTLKALEAWKAE
jgi:hypothetical protein